MKKLLFVFLMMFLLAGVTSCTNQEQPKKSLDDEVDVAIAAFLKNHARKYVDKSTSMYDPHVVRAIAALASIDESVSLDDYTTKNEAESALIEDAMSIADLFKAVLVLDALGANMDSLKAQVMAISEVDVYSYTYALILFKLLGIENEVSIGLSEKIITIRPEDYRDADYAGVALMALADDAVNKNALLGLIEDSLIKEGISFWGMPSGATTATVIMGLISQGISPTSTAYTTQGVNLIRALLEYEVDGAFKNELDKQIDYDFATPQAFAALVSYKVFRVKQVAFNLYLS